MDHITARNRLSAYMDGELPPESRADLQSHLAACPPCAAELAALQKNSDLLRQLPIPTPAPAILLRLHSALDSAARRPVKAIEHFVGLLSGIAACLAILGGLMIMQPTNAAPVPAPWEKAAGGAVQITDDSTTSTNQETAIGQWMVSSLSSSQGDAP